MIVASKITDEDAALDPMGGVEQIDGCHFIVPGAPYGKGRPRMSRVNGISMLHTPAKTVAYEGLVRYYAHQEMMRRGMPLFMGPVAVQMKITVPVAASWSKKKQRAALSGELRPTTKPDIDNVEKAIFDAINGVVWKDDVQVVEVRKSKQYGAMPGVCVHITAVGEK